MADKIDVPAWFERALDATTPTTENNETMRTESNYSEKLGGEVIYPTIRMNKAGKLFRPKNPMKSAIANGDYILIEGPPGEETAAKATALSKKMSQAVEEARMSPTDRKIKEAEDRLMSKLSDKVSFNEGGLLDEGGSIDEESGNDVPPGALEEEVRDDIPAQLSEGEFVLPADVVRYIGLENLMQLRQKAKEGLAQMDAMGQMGNSDEATMSDTSDFDAEIDDIIDNFDPNDPETLAFAQGGYVPDKGLPAPQGNQQFTYGYMPQTTYTPQSIARGPRVNRYARMTAAPGTGITEQRQYIGPNGEMRTFTFIDGRPTEEIPKGFKVYNPEQAGVPEVKAPEVNVASVSESGGGNNEGNANSNAEYEGYVSEMNQLANLDPKIAETWNSSAHNPNNPKGGLKGFIAGGGILGALKSDYGLHSTVQERAPAIAEAYGLNINDYKNTGLAGVFSTYNTDRLASDASVAKAVSDSLGIDPKSLSRDQKNLFMEDLLTEKELNDILGTDKSIRDSKSFAEAARSGVYDDKGYEKYDSPTTPSTVGGGTIDASGNVAVGNVVSSVTDDKLSQAAKNIAAGNSDISVGNISITGVTEKGEVNVDINGDGKADRAVDSKGNSRNFNIDNESSGGDSDTSGTDSGGIGGVDASGDTDPGDGPSGDASAGADASGSPGTDNDTADADSEDSGVGSGGAGVGG
jgi:hypothetical protein